jgi:hypothetical protein
LNHHDLDIGRSTDLAKRIFIASHQGLGDLILCNGIFREYAKMHNVCFLAVKVRYIEAVRSMLGDLNNIRFLPLPERRSWKAIRLYKIFFRALGIKVLGLGSYGKNFFPDGIRFDENFYNQANVDFAKRWSSFYYPRNPETEQLLFRALGCEKGEYIFLHEDDQRGYTINRELITSKHKIITPKYNKWTNNFFDYGFLLENAAEIHCIESSFVALIESLQIPVTKYAHRYARPHALNDFRHEFTYHSSWIIYK